MKVRMTGVDQRTRIFNVNGAKYDTTKGQLTLAARDGYTCLQVEGSWEIEFTQTMVRHVMSNEDIVREQEGQGLVVLQ